MGEMGEIYLQNPRAEVLQGITENIISLNDSRGT